MKRMMLALALALPLYAQAIPVIQGPSVNTQTIIGYQEVEKTYNGWGGGFLHIFGHKHKHYQIPIYGSIITTPVPSVPEPSIYFLMLIALVIVSAQVRRSHR